MFGFFRLNSINRKLYFFIPCLIFLFLFFLMGIFNNTIQAQCDPTSGDPMGCLTVIGTNSGYTDKTVEQIIIEIIDASLSLLFLVVLGFMIYGGYFWMTSMGNEEKIKKSKQILTASIVGLLIVLMSLSIVNFVSTAIGVTPQNLPTDTGLFGGTLNQALTNIIKSALTLVGVISLAIMVYGGFRWMTSAGNEETISEAKRTLTAGAIGLAVIVISWSIVYFIVNSISPPIV